MRAAGSDTYVPADEPVIQFTRLLDAPRELVWEVWTDPRHVGHWWGPNAFTITTHAMDVRPGGRWEFAMHSAEYGDYDNVATYREVIRPERLVYSLGDPADPDQFLVTVTFTPEGRKTRLVMHSRFPSVAARDRVIREVGALEGGQQHLDGLEAYLAERQR